MKKIITAFMLMALITSCLKKEGEEIDEIIKGNKSIEFNMDLPDVVQYEFNNEITFEIKEGSNVEYDNFTLKYEFTKGKGEFYLDGNKYSNQVFSYENKWTYKPLTSGEQFLKLKLYRNDSLKADKTFNLNVIDTKVSDFDFSFTKDFDVIENNGQGNFILDITSLDNNAIDANFEMSFTINNSSVGDLIHNGKTINPGSNTNLVFGKNNFTYKVNQKGNYVMKLEFTITVDGKTKSRSFEFNVKKNEPPVITNVEGQLLRDSNSYGTVCTDIFGFKVECNGSIKQKSYPLYKTYISIKLSITDDDPIEKVYVEFINDKNEAVVLYDGEYTDNIIKEVGNYYRIPALGLTETKHIYSGAKPGASCKVKVTDSDGNTVEKSFNLLNTLGTK